MIQTGSDKSTCLGVQARSAMTSLILSLRPIPRTYLGQANLFEEREPGLLLAVVTLLLGIVARNYEG